MKNPHRLSFPKSITSFVVVLVCSIATFAQQPPPSPSADTLSGKYEGVAKITGSPDAKLVLELKKEGDKITGRATAGDSTVDISEGTFANGTLTLKFVGREGALTAKVDGDKITGDWVSGARKGTVDLKKVPATAEAAATAAAPINLSGEWEAVADAQGQPFPFNLILKVEGEKVTGSSSSQLGDSVISSGTWKDGQLNVNLESSNGVIVLSATVIEGKLSGVYDYAGQLQGRWVAVKKK